jgi:hypothetical protein
MRYRLLGQTGLYVSEMCLGTMTYGGGGAGIWASIGKLQQDAVDEQVKTAVDAGINFIDTANVYSLGQSETLLGQSLKSLGLPRDQLIIATKATGSMDETPNGRGPLTPFEEQGAGRRPPRYFRFSGGEQGARISVHRGHAPDGRRAADFGGADCAGLAAGQAVRLHGHHRREVDGSTAGQHRSDARAIDRFGAQDARRGAAAGISGLDADLAGSIPRQTAGQGLKRGPMPLVAGMLVAGIRQLLS